MSRIGKKPITIPANVKVVLEGNTLKVEGPKATLSQTIAKGVKVAFKDREIEVDKVCDDKKGRSLHGLTRSLLANMVHGVSEGFQKKLEIVGVGYKAEADGTVLKMSLGFSHPVSYKVPEGIKVSVDKQTSITVEGADKQLVGEVAAKIRSYRKPEPYKGKGIRYSGEVVKRKAGKAGSK